MQDKPSATSARQKTIEEDARLVAAAKEQREAFGALYNKYWESVYRFVYRRLQDEDDVKDVSQMVFIKALNKIQSYEPRGYAFSSWLFRIAISEISNCVRKRQSERAVFATPDAEELYDEGEKKERNVQLLVDALNKLSESDLVLVELRFFEKRRLKDIADILGITENNCKVKMHRCLKRLKKHMS